MSKPPSYCGQSHSSFVFDINCTDCSLGKRRSYLNSKSEAKNKDVAVGNAGPEDLSQVKLIIISDHPGAYESNISRGYPMVDNRLVNPKATENPKYRRNAGALIRDALQGMYNLDSYNEVLFLNAVRCNPTTETIIEGKHLRPCVSKWLRNDLFVIEQKIPKSVPFLIAGKFAFKAIAYIYPKEWEELKNLGLNNCRRRKDITLGGRPTVFCYNPAMYARGEMKLETEAQLRRGIPVPKEATWWNPPIVGSAIWHFVNDLSYLQFFI